MVFGFQIHNCKIINKMCYVEQIWEVMSNLLNDQLHGRKRAVGEDPGIRNRRVCESFSSLLLDYTSLVYSTFVLVILELPA